MRGLLSDELIDPEEGIAIKDSTVCRVSMRINQASCSSVGPSAIPRFSRARRQSRCRTLRGCGTFCVVGFERGSVGDLISPFALSWSGAPDRVGGLAFCEVDMILFAFVGMEALARVVRRASLGVESSNTPDT
jgi:hypothetical protein